MSAVISAPEIERAISPEGLTALPKPALGLSRAVEHAFEKARRHGHDGPAVAGKGGGVTERHGASMGIIANGASDIATDHDFVNAITLSLTVVA